MAQGTEVKGRGNIQLNPLKTVVLKYTGDSHKGNHMHYRNKGLFDIAVKLLIDLLCLFTLVCVIPWRRLSFCSMYLTLSILNFIRSPHALLSSTHYRALVAADTVCMALSYLGNTPLKICSNNKLVEFDSANLGVEKMQ